MDAVHRRENNQEAEFQEIHQEKEENGGCIAHTIVSGVALTVLCYCFYTYMPEIAKEICFERAFNVLAQNSCTQFMNDTPARLSCLLQSKELFNSTFFQCFV